MQTGIHRISIGRQLADEESIPISSTLTPIRAISWTSKLNNKHETKTWRHNTTLLTILSMAHRKKTKENFLFFSEYYTHAAID